MKNIRRRSKLSFILAFLLITALIINEGVWPFAQAGGLNTQSIRADDFSGEEVYIDDSNLFEDASGPVSQDQSGDLMIGDQDSSQDAVVVNEEESSSIQGSAQRTEDQKELVTSDGQNGISILYTEEAGIPEDSVLKLRDLKEKEIKAYLDRAKNALSWTDPVLNYIRIYDLTIQKNNDVDVRYLPASSVMVEIRILDSAVMSQEQKQQFIRQNADLLDQNRTYTDLEQQFTELRQKYVQQMHLENLQIISLGQKDELLQTTTEDGVIRFKADKLYPYVLLMRSDDMQESSWDFNAGEDPAAVWSFEDVETEDILKEAEKASEETEETDEDKEEADTDSADTAAGSELLEGDSSEELSLTETESEIILGAEEESGEDSTEFSAEDSEAKAPEEAPETEAESEDAGIESEDDPDGAAETGDSMEEPANAETDRENINENEEEDNDLSDFEQTEEKAGTPETEQQLVSSGEDYEISVVYGSDAKIPEGSELVVNEISENTGRFDTLSEQAIAALDTDEDSILAVKLVDVSINKDGETIEPETEVGITVQLTAQEDNQAIDTQVIAISDTAEVLEASENPEAAAAAEAVTYETASHTMDTVYAIVTRSLTKELIASDGNEYLVTVTYDGTSGIPSDAELTVSEIREGDAEYAGYVEKSASALGEKPENLALARPFDITLKNPETGEEYQPDGNVQVSIELLKDDLNSYASVDVVHIPDGVGSEAEVMDTTVHGESVEFETSGFSVYVVVSTVLKQTLTASDGNEYLVTVTYDNTSGIPEDAELYVSEIKEGEAGYEEYVAQSAAALGEKPENLAFARPFDITLKNPQTGEEYQPNGNVQVSIELLKDDLNSYASVDVVHIPDEVGVEAQVMDTTVHGESVEFETSGFSVYVLTGSGGEPKPMWTFSFLKWDSDLDTYVEVDGTTQRVKNGEKPFVPQLPSDDAQEFAGWYENKNTSGTAEIILADEPFDFDSGDYDGDGAPGFSVDGATMLYAKYADYAYVIFHDQYDSDTGTWPVAYTRRGELTGAPTPAAQVRIDDLSVSYTGGESLAFCGWSRTPVTTPGVYRDPDTLQDYAISTNEIPVTGETHLYPVFKAIHWLTYYTAQSGLGAAYVPSEYVFNGEGLSSPLPVTFRSGYEFQGWYTGSLVTTTVDGKSIETVNFSKQVTDAEGRLFPVGSAVPYLETPDGGVSVEQATLHLSANATLYAKWRATYNIVIWKQSPTDPVDDDDSNNKYVYFETLTRTADIGDIVRFDSSKVTFPGYVYDDDDGPKMIGNTEEITVIKVYYDLDGAYTPTGDTHTLTFEDSEAGTGVVMPHAYDGTDGYEKIAYGTLLSSISVVSPDDRTHDGNVVYTFKGWYMDRACKNPADLSTMTMPDYDLTLYAGWEPEWFLVKIDPNYGALWYYDEGELKGDGATWFWQTYDDEPIGEYAHTTRDYVESSSGSYYYVNKNRDYYGLPDEWSSSESGKEKKSYYTPNISEATEDTTFEYAPGSYSYIGWYEVFDDGTEAEEPYDFTQHTDHNTTLRLHWKKTGKFYVAFDAGDGTLEDGTTKKDSVTQLTTAYADNADVVLSRMATAPNDYNFIGWKVKGDNGRTVYAAGETFTLHAENAVRESGRDVVWLEAVYARSEMVTIVYNANGGTISGSVDYGYKPDNAAQSGWATLSGSVNQSARTATTTTPLTNNSHYKLSDGTGFAWDGKTLVGWSNKPVYDPADSDAELYDLGGEYGVDTNGGSTTTLYAVWGVTVTYVLNTPASHTAAWGGEGEGGAWNSAYTLVDGKYTQSAYLNAPVSEPGYIDDEGYFQPYIPKTSDGTQMFYYWETRIEAGTVKYDQYDFSQPVTGDLTLYACWDGAVEVPVHAVDASDAALSKQDGWLTGNGVLSVMTEEVRLNAVTATGCTHLPADYEYAFAVALDKDTTPTRDNVFEYDAVTAIYYNQSARHLYVKYADGRADSILDEDTDIFFVFYEKKAREIHYQEMLSSGELKELNNVNASAPLSTGTSLLGEYKMAERITAPLNWVSGYSHYAFAVGEAGATNASHLDFITDKSDSDASRPVLRLRNTWQGFQYTTEVGDDAEWVSCGYDPVLYVVYYQQDPTVIIFRERTVGTGDVMGTEFIFDIKVTDSTGTVLYDTTDPVDHPDDQPFVLTNGKAQSAILFYDANGENAPISQTIEITQRENPAFTTTTMIGDSETQTRTWSCTSTEGGGTKNVIFTNTHKALPVEAHVAILESSSIRLKDTEYRSTNEADHLITLPLGESANLLTCLPNLFTGDTTIYALGAIVYGTDNGTVVSVEGMGVESLAYSHTSGDLYELLVNGDADTPLGQNNIYYVYYEMPQIRYMKETSGGVLSEVYGSLDGVHISDTDITYNKETITLNDVLVQQRQRLPIPVNSVLTITQTGNHFRMPPNLDDGTYEGYLTYAKLGAGASDAVDLGLGGKNMFIRLGERGGGFALQYSYTALPYSWVDFPDSPAVFAIYDERGYDLMISKNLDTTDSGAQPIFTDSTFTVTISSMSITKDSYPVTGFDSANIAAVPADGETPGTITLTVEDGSSVRIKGLGQGTYTVTESENANYVLTAKKGTIIDGANDDVLVENNSAIRLELNSETKLDLKNTPQQLCKINDNGTNHIFYTFADAIEYVENNIPDLTATIEMLSDYLMPYEDLLEIPHNFHITLTTADDKVGDKAVITRSESESMNAEAMVKNSGTLTLSNVILDGADISVSAPLIQSSGNLTVGVGAELRNAFNTGDGGAINATGGDITVSDGVIGKGDETGHGNSAARGGAIFYTGTGTITLNADARLVGNTAAGAASGQGQGGAIYAAQGTIVLSGTSVLQNNEASYQGGAIWAGNATIEINQNANVSGNAAKSGGAIYASTADITISKTDNIDPPVISGNRATDGSGGAINVGAGSVSVTGGSISGNTATNGNTEANGGAIWANTASVSVSGTAALETNQAKNGGAIYAKNGTVAVSGGSMSKNEATDGDGGAIYADSGNVTLSDNCSLTGNKATAGSGGAVYANSGAVSAAELTATGNSAKNGGAIYADTGAVTASKSTIGPNTASESGGAIYAKNGNVTLREACSLTGNTATAGNGGAIYAEGAAVSVTGGVVSGNHANSGSGGAIRAAYGTVTFSSTQITGNSAGSGGVISTDSGSVTFTSCTTVTGNSATSNGGVAATGSGGITATGSTFGGTAEGAGNSAESGGVFYSDSGSVSVSSTAMTGNRATNGDGGAICTVSGNVTLSTTTLSSNTATANGGAFSTGSGTVGISGTGSITGNTAANGGAFYVDSGSATLTSITVTGNTTTNGSAIFVNKGSATFSAGTITGNTATNGGAVGVGDPMARLNLSDNIQIKNNTIAGSTDKANIYLDQDADNVININNIGTGAEIGVYVPNKMITVDEKQVDVYSLRGVPGAVFAAYTTTGENNITSARVKNDRNPGFSVQKDAEAKLLYWGNGISVEVRYLADFTNGFPASKGTLVKQYGGTYYPMLNDGALSELAADIYTSLSATEQALIPATAAYGGAYLAANFNVTSFSDSSYVTKLKWDSVNSKWTLERFDGETVDLSSQKLIIYYAEPAYIAIENNTEMPLDISTLTVGGKSVINPVTSDESLLAGYGMTYAKNGAIRSGLLPITASDLELAVDSSITLLIPGGRNLAYSLNGAFQTTQVDTVQLRTGTEGSLTPQNLTVAGDGTFTPSPITGTTITGTYHIIFGTDKNICKVVDDNKDEYVFPKISEAISFIQNPSASTRYPDNHAQFAGKKGTVQLLTDYLLPASDPVVIPRKYDITLTTAATGPDSENPNPKETHWYTPTPEKVAEGETRATLSRDSENDLSMIDAYVESVTSKDGTVLRMESIIIDGKSVRGSSNGGAVFTKYCDVYVKSVDFLNVFAGSGGALFVVFDFNKSNPNKKDGYSTVQGTTLTVEDSTFIGCNSTKATSERLGGGAIVTNAASFTLNNSRFENCYASDQAGAVFHRVDGNYNSWTNISGCSFSNCRAKAAGGLELDSKTITVTNTHFLNCVATARNGGGFNAYMLNNAGSSSDSWITLSGCTFTNCTANDFGGGFRSTGRYTTLENCTITNCSTKAKGGGGIGISSSNAMRADIFGCTVTGCNATNTIGGGIYYAGKDLTIRDSSITNCTANSYGGGIYYDKGAGSFTMTNATVTGNRTNTTQGGGLNIKSNNVWITGSIISNNTSKNQGGGIYSDAKVQVTIAGTEISRNTSTNSNGGGVWYDSAESDAAKAEIARNSMALTVNGCTIDGNTAPNNYGGGIYTQVKTVTIGDYTYTDDEGEEQTKHTSISNNISKNSGGGLYHSREVAGSRLTITNAAINGNRVTANSMLGGGVYTNARTLTITGGSISQNTATGNGGGLWYDSTANNNENRGLMKLTVSGCAVNGNTSGASGGGIFTQIKDVTVQINGSTRASISGNTAALSGGGLYQKSSLLPGSKLNLSDVTIDGNKANGTATANGFGGGVFTDALTVKAENAQISNNTAKNNGGGLYDYNEETTLHGDMSLEVKVCLIKGNESSKANGGGIYTCAQTLTLEGDPDKNPKEYSTISDCTASLSGGGICQVNANEGATADISNSTIKNCTASGNADTEGGGGIYSNAGRLTLDTVTLEGNTANANGGGVMYDFERHDFYTDNKPDVGGLTVDKCLLTKNTANKGGAVYTNSYMRLRNDTEITGNRLSSNDVENAAAVYLVDGATLVVGIKVLNVHENDTLIVKDNYTNAGKMSDVRLWSDQNKENNEHSIYVYCNLSTNSMVRVANAFDVGTKFGESAIKNPLGFTQGFTGDFSVFLADDDSLRGIIDRAQSNYQSIIWGGPAVCKITDGTGNLLYLRKNSEGKGADPAIFDRLDTGNPDDDGITSAFSVLRMETNLPGNFIGPELYYENGDLYTGTDYCVKMLVASFTTESRIIILYKENRHITLTTASDDAHVEGDYYFEYGTTDKSKTKTCTVLRGKGVEDEKPLLSTQSNLTLSDVILDGGSLDGIAAGKNSSIIEVDQAGITVNLLKAATLQNVTTEDDGGGVYVKAGSFVIGDETTGGVIRNSRAENGGAVFAKDGATVTFNRGNIIQCAAAVNGGGINMEAGTENNGALYMNGGAIERCTAGEGGGVFVGDGKAFHLGGTNSRIAGNSAISKGGGIAVGGDNARLYFSGKPAVTGNTRTGSVASNHICNVELDYQTTNIIQVEGTGLMNGANIGVYVPGDEGRSSCYDNHGVERKPFGTYAEGSNDKTFYSFVNDRNGLKGGLISGTEGNLIYWVKIFSLDVSLTGIDDPATGNSISADETFEFEVRLTGPATVSGQNDAEEIDGEFGGMVFYSGGSGSDYTTAYVSLKLGETVTGENLSDGLNYTVTPRFTEDQIKRYGVLPAQYTGKIGENNKDGVQVAETERYISHAPFRVVLAVCKLTDWSGSLLYYKYTSDSTTPTATPSSANIPAVFPSVNAAMDALTEKQLYSDVNSYASAYTVGGGVQLQMLVQQCALPQAVTQPADVPVTLKTASAQDMSFPYRGSQATVATVTRAFNDGSMFTVNDSLTITGITLGGARTTYTGENGGIVYVSSTGSLTIGSSATLQKSKVSASGGAVYVADGGTVSLNDGTIAENQAVSGGAVYVADGGTVSMSGGMIEKNTVTTASGKGAGMYLATGSTLELSGAPGFGRGTDNYGNINETSANYAGSLMAQKNGGKNYTHEHQDIYLEETAGDPASLVLKSNLTGSEGSIWIWADNTNRYGMASAFAMVDFDPDTVTDTTYHIFRNAQTDQRTYVSDGKYLTGDEKREKDGFIYWTGGYDVIFKKIDGFGNALSGAEFTLYTDSACNTVYRRNGDDVTATSAVGTEKTSNNVTIDKGLALIEKLPAGVYYMKETTAPDGYKKDAQVYIVLVGQAELSKFSTYGLTQESEITAQTTKYKDAYETKYGVKNEYAIFLYQNGKAVTTPDIAKYGIMNTSTAERKVILRKVSNTYASLEGAVFEILRYDHTLVSSTDINGDTTTSFTSGASGVYFIDMLPFGTYYLHETTIPSGYQEVTAGDDGNWFILTVSEDGAGYKLEQDTGSVIRNTLSPETSKPG